GVEGCGGEVRQVVFFPRVVQTLGRIRQSAILFFSPLRPPVPGFGRTGRTAMEDQTSVVCHDDDCRATEPRCPVCGGRLIDVGNMSRCCHCGFLCCQECDSTHGFGWCQSHSAG